MRNNRLENEILQRVDELVQCAISVSLKDEASRAEQLTRGIAMVQEMGDLLLEVLEGREQHLQALLEQLVAQRLPDRRILQSFGNFPRDIQHIISEGITSYLKARKEKRSDMALPGETAPAAATPGEATPEETVAATPGEVTLEETASTTPYAAAGPPPPETLSISGEEETAGHPALEEPPCPAPAPGPDTAPEPVAILGAGISPEEGGEEGTIPAEAADTAPAVPAPDPLETLRLAILQAYPEEEIIINYDTRGVKIPFFLPRLLLGFEPAGIRHDWRHDFYCRQQGISIRKVAADELANPAYLARRLRREATWRQLN